MSDAWKELRERNESENEIRDREENRVTRITLHIAPALPAFFWLVFADALLIDIVGEVGFLDSIRDVLGPQVVAYIVVLSYFVLIYLFRISFYKIQSPRFSIIVTWLAWAWFYFSIWKLESLPMAVTGLLVLSWFALRIVGWLTFCFDVIRDGMFLGRGDRP